MHRMHIYRRNAPRGELSMRILHLEDDPNDALLIEASLQQEGLPAAITHIDSAAEFRDAVRSGTFDAVIVDNGVPGFNAKAALEYSQLHRGDLPVIVCSGAARPEDISARLREGASDFVLKDHLWQLAASLRRVDERSKRRAAVSLVERHNLSVLRLLNASQELAVARDLAAIMRIVRQAARELTHADGATLALRDGTQCFYADEDAVGPLWKGQRVSLSACLDGWAMLHRQSVAIEDIYADPRVPIDAYRSTFVKSLAIVPILAAQPLGAIGSYWAQQHAPTPEELSLLEILANTTAAAVENVQRHAQQEQRLRQRNQELQAAHRELEAFSYAVTHDLRAPLRAVAGQLQIIVEDCASQLTDDAMQRVARAQNYTQHMAELMDGLLQLSQLDQSPLHIEQINLSQLVAEAVVRLRTQSPERKAHVRIEEGVYVAADRGLLQTAIDQLVGNAWKFSMHRQMTLIEFGVETTGEKHSTYYLKDNGAGFNMQAADRLFRPFLRMHSTAEFPGLGIGLAAARRVIERHGGQIWTEAAEDQGATFYFSLQAT